MHSEDGEEDLTSISAYYGSKPMIAGILFAGAIVWFMFAVADGFS